MPSVNERRKVLDDRAEVCSYTRDPGTFYLRVWHKESRSYKSSRIDGAGDIDEAASKALDVYLAITSGTSPSTSKAKNNGDVQKARKKNGVITDLIERYLAEELEKVEKGLLKPGTVKNKQETLRNHLIPYLKEQKVTKTNDIKVGVFDRYELVRAGCSRHTIRRELAAMKMFCAWLHRHRLIDPYEFNADLFKPVKLKDEDWDSNPPIRDEKEWKIILKHLHAFVKEGERHPKKKVGMARKRFWTLLLLLKNGGFRPSEALALRWSDLEFENVGRISQSKREAELQLYEEEGMLNELNQKQLDSLGRVDRYVVHVRVLASKTGALREVTCNAASPLARWKKELRMYMDKHEEHFTYNGVVLARSEKDGLPIIPMDTPVFSIPEKNEWKMSDYSIYNYYWRELMKRAKDELRGPILSPHRYTIYSLRSTRAVELFELGVDPFLSGKQLGHLPDMMAKIYARLPSRKRATKEAAHIQFGKRDDGGEIVDVDDIS